MRYISDKVISFSVMVNGTDKRIRFTPMMGGGSIYITDSAAEIEALEKNSAYRNGIFRRAPGETVKVEKGKKNKPVPVKGISSWQDAREYLVSELGCTGELNTPEEISAEAGARGVSFPDLKAE